MNKYKAKPKRYIEVSFRCMLRTTGYNNTYPYNCAYFTGAKLLGDCWCIHPKATIWGEALGTPICDNFTKGKYILPSEGYAASGLPDWTGDRIMDELCKGVSTDFSKLVPCELLLIDGDHMGIYLGEWTYEGRTYNTAEVTANYLIGPGYGASYVDASGNRLTHKNGSVQRKWDRHGQLVDFIDYTEVYEGIAQDVLNEILNPKTDDDKGDDFPMNKPEVSPFSDVSADDPKYKHIKALYDMGIVNGYSDGTFKPKESITREDMCVIANKIVNPEYRTKR